MYCIRNTGSYLSLYVGANSTFVEIYPDDNYFSQEIYDSIKSFVFFPMLVAIGRLIDIGSSQPAIAETIGNVAVSSAGKVQTVAK